MRRRGVGRVHGEVQGSPPSVYEAVYGIVRRIPRGRVMTYGQIAVLLLNRISPRAVGWALHGCPEDVPWHRVVNGSGGCSTERLPDMPLGLQAALLEAEGVVFRPNRTLDLARHQWFPRGTPRMAGRARRTPEKGR